MGKVIMSGIVPPLVAPISGILASDLSVGSSVYLMEGGAAVEYLVVNQGKPSGSSLYDDSCNGMWVLRKDIYEKRQWHSSNSNSYKASTIHSYLNSTFLNLFNADIQTVIKEVKIPYVNGTANSAVASGANGLDAKIFLLSGYEVGFTQSEASNFPIDGAKLDYFVSGNDSTVQAKRIANLNGSVTSWWLRSPYTGKSDLTWIVNLSGNSGANDCSYSSYGIRPALILPPNALFDTNTMLLKGVA